MDGASISFREELRLDAPQRTGFPEQLPFGMGQLLTRASFNPPEADFYVLKDIARYVLSYSKPLELLSKDLALPGW